MRCTISRQVQNASTPVETQTVAAILNKFQAAHEVTKKILEIKWQLTKKLMGMFTADMKKRITTNYRSSKKSKDSSFRNFLIDYINDCGIVEVKILSQDNTTLLNEAVKAIEAKEKALKEAASDKEKREKIIHTSLLNFDKDRNIRPILMAIHSLVGHIPENFSDQKNDLVEKNGVIEEGFFNFLDAFSGIPKELSLETGERVLNRLPKFLSQGFKKFLMDFFRRKFSWGEKK